MIPIHVCKSGITLTVEEKTLNDFCEIWDQPDHLFQKIQLWPNHKKNCQKIDKLLNNHDWNKLERKTSPGVFLQTVESIRPVVLEISSDFWKYLKNSPKNKKTAESSSFEQIFGKYLTKNTKNCKIAESSQFEQN